MAWRTEDGGQAFRRRHDVGRRRQGALRDQHSNDGRRQVSLQYPQPIVCGKPLIAGPKQQRLLQAADSSEERVRTAVRH